MSRRLCSLILLAGVFGATPLWAVQLSRPQAEYSADSMMQTEEATTQLHVYVTPMKERKEMLTDAGEGAIQIFRHDKKVMWQVMPSEHMYMEHSMTGKPQSNDVSQWDFQETVMGDETLNGVKVTKYKTIATSTDGRKYGGFSWRTKEGIPVKQDLLYKEGNDKKRILIELSNLKIGRQDPKLFEIPEGYTKIDMSGMMGGIMGGAMDKDAAAQRRMSRPATPRPGTNVPVEDTAPVPEPELADDDRSDMQKAGDLMKGLLGY